MTATNHAATGALIGVVLASPIAIPIAFLSHFFLDALPHFGLAKRDTLFKIYLAIDASIVLLLIGLLTNYDVNIPIVIASMLAAVLPDVVWAFRWYKEANKGADPNIFHNPITKFHANIQWFEKPVGLAIEAVWFLVIMYLITLYI